MRSIVNDIPLNSIRVFGENVSDTLILTCIVFAFVILLYYVSKVVNEYIPNSQFLQACNFGECGTNLYTGEKRCASSSTDKVLIDPQYEVCNSAYVCDHYKTPYALMSNGETNRNGVCEPNTICRCLTHSQCSDNTAVMFEVINGSIYTNSRYTLNQTTISSDVSFCSIKPFRLNRLSNAGCPFTEEEFNNDPMNTIKSCVQKNPCVSGTMALIPDSSKKLMSSGFTRQVARETPVACIDGTKVCVNSVPFWNSSTETLECL